MSEHPTCVHCGEKAQFEIDGVWVCFNCDPYTVKNNEKQTI